MKIEKGMQERIISEELSFRFKQYRIKYPMTMTELAEKSKVSVGTIVRFENGNDIGFLNLIKLMKVLGLENSIDLLIPELPNETTTKAGLKPMPRVKRARNHKNIDKL